MTWAQRKRSLSTQLLLAAAFGPLGLLYSSPVGGVGLFFLAVVLGLFSGGYGALLTWPLAIAFGFVTVRGHNRRLAQGRQQGAATTPATGNTPLRQSV